MAFKYYDVSSYGNCNGSGMWQQEGRSGGAGEEGREEGRSGEGS